MGSATYGFAAGCSGLQEGSHKCSSFCWLLCLLSYAPQETVYFPKKYCNAESRHRFGGPSEVKVNCSGPLNNQAEFDFGQESGVAAGRRNRKEPCWSY